MDNKEGQATTQIKITIAGRTYPLQVNIEDEVTMRKIVKDINEDINKFQMMYQDKDKQDCLAMVALSNAVDLQKLSNSTQTDILSRKLSDIEVLLDSSL